MSAEGNKGYLLIFRGNEWHQGLSSEQMQQVSSAWMAWFNGLRADGRCLGGNPLEATGKVVSGPGGRVVSDGPFAESKEAVGGYFLLKVDSLEEAVAIARDCPGLPHGAQVEVRPIAPECPMLTELREENRLVGQEA